MGTSALSATRGGKAAKNESVDPWKSIILLRGVNERDGVESGAF